MQAKFRKGVVYRNIKMNDVDFYVTNVKLHELVGYWLTRPGRLITNKDPDKIPFHVIKQDDWIELND